MNGYVSTYSVAGFMSGKRGITKIVKFAIKKLITKPLFMKEFTVTNFKEGDVTNHLADSKKPLDRIVVTGEDDMQVSDGYHTMDELYDHRIALFMALCKVQDAFCTLGKAAGVGVTHQIWKSKRHHADDKAMFEGWFVAGITLQNGEQISYHLPLEKWDALNVPELEHAPKWDGHTPEDVLERLAKL